MISGLPTTEEMVSLRSVRFTKMAETVCSLRESGSQIMWSCGAVRDKIPLLSRSFEEWEAVEVSEAGAIYFDVNIPPLLDGGCPFQEGVLHFPKVLLTTCLLYYAQYVK